MNYEIIIYGKHNPYFYFFNERLKEYGIDAEICYVNKCDIIEKLYLKKYCTVVIFHETNEIRTAENISEIKRYFPDLPVIVVSYSSVYKICRKFIDAGAEKCIVMPVKINSICKIIMKTISSYRVCIPEIDDFMNSFNFPRHLNGFYYLCNAVELCVISPDRLSNIISEVYEPVGNRFGIGTEIVERSLRYFSKVASDKGLFGSLFGNEKDFRPSNHELICYLADNFVNRFDIYNKHKSVKTEGMNRFAIWESYSNNIFLNHHHNYFY